MTIRRYREDDLQSIREIALLDSQYPREATYLVAELGDEIVAALALETGLVVANPFRRTAEAVALLRLRSEQLASSHRRVRAGWRRLALRRLASG